MKYFIDTEFIEGVKKPLFGKKRHFIDLISIGIKAEDGREYYAISNEFNWKDADDWVKENVLNNIMHEYLKSVNGDIRNMALSSLEGVGIGNTTKIQKWIGKSNKQIAEEVREFVSYSTATCENGSGCCLIVEPIKEDFENEHLHHKMVKSYDSIPEFYGYYSDYDWVLFCSLFGRMIDLPKRFPMYCKDLKQMLDEKAFKRMNYVKGNSVGLARHEASLELIKSNPDYPIQKEEHNALADAKWIFELYKFLKSL